MRPVLAAFVLMVLGVSVAVQATPAPVSVTGNTTADGELLRDTLVYLTQFAPSFGCDRITSVDTYVLPPDTIRAKASFRMHDNQATYERWQVTVCGKVERFLIIYSPDPQGGTIFAINYPYPQDAP
jgi:hypothetical protein